MKQISKRPEFNKTNVSCHQETKLVQCGLCAGPCQAYTKGGQLHSHQEAGLGTALAELLLNLARSLCPVSLLQVTDRTLVLVVPGWSPHCPKCWEPVSSPCRMARACLTLPALWCKHMDTSSCSYPCPTAIETTTWAPDLYACLFSTRPCIICFPGIHLILWCPLALLHSGISNDLQSLTMGHMHSACFAQTGKWQWWACLV